MYCDLTKTMCKYCINKRCNYGFVSGTAGYCKVDKRWTSDMKQCPNLQGQEWTKIYFDEACWNDSNNE